jgi:predicted translin family RNA/ssDNA-binding protein
MLANPFGCPQRQKLLELLREAVREYGDAVEALNAQFHVMTDESFREAKLAVDLARHKIEGYTEALIEHKRDHQCG